MDYLAYAYLQTGQEADAQRVLADLNAIWRVNQPIFTVAYAATAIPAAHPARKSPLERGGVAEASGQCREAGCRWRISSGPSAHIHFARAIGAARSGDARLAREESGKLRAIEDAMVIPAGTYDWRKQVSIEREIAAAWATFAEGQERRCLA